jgi:hypothetical protein
MNGGISWGRSRPGRGCSAMDGCMGGEWWKHRSRSVGLTGFSTEIRSMPLLNTGIERYCYTSVFHDMSNDAHVWKTRVQRPIWTCFSVVTFLSHPQNSIYTVGGVKCYCVYLKPADYMSFIVSWEVRLKRSPVFRFSLGCISGMFNL